MVDICPVCEQPFEGRPVRFTDERVRARMKAAGFKTLDDAGLSSPHFEWETTPPRSPVIFFHGVTIGSGVKIPEYVVRAICAECLRRSTDAVTLLGKIKVEDDDGEGRSPEEEGG